MCFGYPRCAYNDPKLKKGTEGLLAPGNRRSFSGCGSAPRSLRPPGRDLAGRLAGPHLVKLGLISPDMRRESGSEAIDAAVLPVDILVPVTLVGLRIVQVWVAGIKILLLAPG